MFHILLFEPEIPPNTGNIIRLAANTGCSLHLVEPLGFELDDKRLKRAGLDYREWANVRRHASFDNFKNDVDYNGIYAFTTKAQRVYSSVEFEPGDVLMFGPETRGLSLEMRKSLGSDYCLRVPMADNSRSLNLSNTVAVAIYEAWRQHSFEI